jgi:hypothetical protein
MMIVKVNEKSAIECRYAPPKQNKSPQEVKSLLKNSLLNKKFIGIVYLS